ncbi:MAG: transglutaminase domain-containing protein [Candidatus Sumerlaeia bacterium]|nr:transglutaminase domain-containing protein [Candidatus Sumerlaeia bacterium]
MRLCTGLTLFALLAGSTPLAHAMEADAFTAEMRTLIEAQNDGRFSEADAYARKLLNERRGELNADQARDLEFEIERIRRVRMDYTVTRERLVELLRQRIPDLTDAEFDAWEAEGRFDVRVIDGQRLYMNSSRSNLFYRHPELKKRQATQSTGTWYTFLWDAYQETLAAHAGTASGTSATYDYELTMTITAKPGTVPAGETIRCWMPFPQQFASQWGVRLLESTPTPTWINAPNYPMRSLYFEQPSAGDAPTVFTATWTMTAAARHFAVDSRRVTPSTAATFAEYDYFTREQHPHIVFTDEFRALEKSIAGGETNPYLRARKYYDWMCRNIVYSYAHEYSTMRNISDFVRSKGYGDCGQLALTYMTLCRLGGIPARWQSGWIIYPMDKNLHDWCEIYIEPYGWIPVDVNYGIFLNRDEGQIDEAQRRELQDYYFGGLDAFRFIANRDHSFPHYPAKKSFLSDTVDFQRGELEAAGNNLYFDQFSYKLEVRYLSTLPGEAAPRDSAGRPQGENLAR